MLFSIERSVTIDVIPGEVGVDFPAVDEEDVVLEVGADVGEIDDGGDIERGEFGCGTDPGEEEELGTVDGTSYIS